MKPIEFLEVAELLQGDGGPFPEGRHRTAVSRCYYAAFLDARDRLQMERSFRFRKRDAHDSVKRAFEWADGKPLKLIGRLLGDLKKLRESADYEIAGTVGSSRVAEALELARQVESLLDSVDLGGCVDTTPQR